MTLTQARKRPPVIHFSWKSIVHIVLTMVFITTAFLLYNQSKGIQNFPIKSVKVIGAKHVDHRQVQHFLIPLVSHGFFGVEVENIKDRLLQIPWIANVSVRRIWPDQVQITIVEKNPIAYWNDESLLSTSGDLFIPEESTQLEGLPQLTGPEGKQLYVLEYYNKINNLLLPLHFTVARLELTPSHIWNVTLNNGMKLTIDYKDFLTRFSHFVKVYPKIIGDRANDIDYVDLRYSNGLAVRWKSIENV